MGAFVAPGGGFLRGGLLHLFAYHDSEHGYALSLCQRGSGAARRAAHGPRCLECGEMRREIAMEEETEYTLSEETVALLKRQMRGCFLCRWILKDHRDHGKLTGWPNSDLGGAMFPVEGKLAHIRLEKLSAEKEKEVFDGTTFGNA